ncbi:MAG: polysaccharide biosynthesis C-terminal domain-containing protein, partial [Desulfobacterales bacterium]
ISVIGNIILGIILMQPLGHGGLALSTSLASMLNLGLLIRSLRKKMGPISLSLITKSTGKTLFCSALMGIVVWGLGLGILPQAEGSVYHLLGGLSVCIGSGFLLYFLLAYLMKSPEMEVVFNTARRGLLKR